MTTSQQDGTMVDKIAQFDLPKELADAENKKPHGHPAFTPKPPPSSRNTTSTPSSSSQCKTPRT